MADEQTLDIHPIDGPAIAEIERALADSRTINPDTIWRLTMAVRELATERAQLVGKRERLQQRIDELTDELDGEVGRPSVDELRESAERSVTAVTACVSALAEMPVDERARALHATGILLGLRPGG